MSAHPQVTQAELEEGRRQVAALMTAWLADPDAQPGTEAYRLIEDATAEAVSNARACVSLLAALYGAFMADLAAAVDMTPLEFWRPAAVHLSSINIGGGPQCPR